MSKVSNIISSYVVSVYNGQIEGIVNNILFNNKKQAKYLVISQNDEQFLVLETKDIYKTGEGAVIVKNSDVLSLMESSELKIKECFSPINSIVVSIDGDYIGHVSDIELDNKYNIKNFIVDGQVFELNKVINISESAIIINTLDTKTSLSKFKSKTKIVMGNERITNQTVSVMSNQTILPNRTMLNYNFLIGRRVSKDILNFNGEIIIKENQTVNSKVLDIARINGKLRELIKVSM